MTTQSTSRQVALTAPNIGNQSRSGYIWLAYSIFFFIDPVMRHERRFWLECLGIYAVFLAVYVGYMYARTNRQRCLLLAGFYLLGMLAYPVNSGASSFFIYSAAFMPFVIPSSPILISVMIAQCLVLFAEGWWLHINLISVTATVFFILVVGTSNAFIARQKRMDCKLRAAQQENVQLAAVAERERIARDLHDVLGHTLSVIVLKAELAGRLLECDPKRAAQEIGDVERTARTALAEVREAIGGYRAQGLAAELLHARHTLDAAGVALTCETEPQADAPTLNATEETVLSLAVREAVTNIVRHAEATRCTMRLITTVDGYYALHVEDDGKHAFNHEGNGLRGMRERVQGLGGRFSIHSDQGTRLLIELPLAVAKHILEQPAERSATR